MLPIFKDIPASFRTCLPNLLASLVYHASFLRSFLNPLHPIFHSPVFASGAVSRLEGKPVTGNFKCRSTGLLATGVPSEMITAIQVSKLAGEVAQLKSRFVEGMGTQQKEIIAEVGLIKVLNRRLLHVALSLTLVCSVLQISKLPKALHNELLDNFTIEGIQQVTRADFSALGERLMSQLTQLLETRLQPPCDGAEDPVAVEDTATKESRDLSFKTYSWGGRFHMVPQGWKLPRPPLKVFYFLWHYGYSSEIQPLKFLCKFDVVRSDWIQYARCKRVIEELERMARSSGIVSSGDTDNFALLGKIRLGEVFDAAYEKLLDDLYGGAVYRKGDKTIGTLYNRITKNAESE